MKEIGLSDQTLFAALATQHRNFELAGAFVEAWNRGPVWRDALKAGRLLLPDEPPRHL